MENTMQMDFKVTLQLYVTQAELLWSQLI